MGFYNIETRGIRILAKMLRCYKQKGQTEFEYWQFVEDAGVIINKNCHQLSKRMERLIVSLEKKTNCMRVVKNGRGKVRLEVLQLIEFLDDR